MRFFSRMLALWPGSAQRRRPPEPQPDPDAVLNVRWILDGNAYWRRKGRTPFTFFGYPTALAGKHDLPPHEGAVRLLAAVQSVGIEVMIWTPEFRANGGWNTFFACDSAEAWSLMAVLRTLESDDRFGSGFIERWSEELQGAPEP